MNSTKLMRVSREKREKRNHKIVHVAMNSNLLIDNSTCCAPYAMNKNYKMQKSNNNNNNDIPSELIPKFKI